MLKRDECWQKNSQYKVTVHQDELGHIPTNYEKWNLIHVIQVRWIKFGKWRREFSLGILLQVIDSHDVIYTDMVKIPTLFSTDFRTQLTKTKVKNLHHFVIRKEQVAVK